MMKPKLLTLIICLFSANLIFGAGLFRRVITQKPIQRLAFRLAHSERARTNGLCNFPCSNQENCPRLTAEVTKDTKDLSLLLQQKMTQRAPKEEIDRLVSKGAELNYQDPKTGETILHKAVRNEDREFIDKLIRSYGLCKKVKNHKGMSPHALAIHLDNRLIHSAF